MRYRTTAPASYFERGTPVKDPVILAYKRDRLAAGELTALIIGAVVWGFALGMLLAAYWAGVL
jgi:hypothetical protein